jgi:hypothetical protein
MLRVNHSREFKGDDGATVNQAEGFFSRLRRAEYGIHHRISGQYLYQYANEMAWREDRRREPNGLQSRSQRLQAPKPLRRPRSGTRSSIGHARPPPPIAVPVAPEDLMPTFLAGLIAQPESDGGTYRMPVLLVRVRRGLCQHGSRSYQAGECDADDAYFSLHRVPRRQCAPAPLTLPKRASRGDCSRLCHVVAGH